MPTRVTECLAEVRIVPKCDCYVIEVIYEKTEQFFAPNEKITAIDLGINNLMAVTSNQPDFIPLLINGRPLKSLNQFYNQRRAKLQSLLKGNRQSSRSSVCVRQWAGVIRDGTLM
ncbi:transposase [Microcystis sp. BLCC-F210]|uniref:transposase n=1 Tax=Microcystis sp. BLCC-F210 TaxID=3342751 RepID=UPI0035C8BF7D